MRALAAASRASSSARAYSASRAASSMRALAAASRGLFFARAFSASRAASSCELLRRSRGPLLRHELFQLHGRFFHASSAASRASFFGTSFCGKFAGNFFSLFAFSGYTFSLRLCALFQLRASPVLLLRFLSAASRSSSARRATSARIASSSASFLFRFTLLLQADDDASHLCFTGGLRQA